MTMTSYRADIGYLSLWPIDVALVAFVTMSQVAVPCLVAQPRFHLEVVQVNESTRSFPPFLPAFAAYVYTVATSSINEPQH